VEQSGGSIVVDSKLGQALFSAFYLPHVRGAIEFDHISESPDSLRNRDVLVVEDETPLRRLIGTILTNAGYNVLEAANGQQALLLCRSNRDASTCC